MPNLSQHPSSDIVKLLAFGPSKTRKTTSLASLVAADYKLRILDHDNLLGPLSRAIKAICPDKINNVEYRTFRDKLKAGATEIRGQTITVKEGVILDGKALAWPNTIRMLDHWKYDDIDLGIPATWGPDCVLVLDSLSRICDAAYNFHDSLTPKTSKKGTDYDARAVYQSAQDDVEKLLAMLTSDTFAVNVIVIGHGAFFKLDDGTTKILPQGVGQKLSPKIPSYFPNVVYYKRDNDKYQIQLESDRMVDLANDTLGRLTAALPIESGLAEIFRVLREQPQKPTTKPFALKIQRA